MFKPTKEEFKSEMKRKGWSRSALAKRWNKSETWISKIANDDDRAQQWNDSLAGLPENKSEL
ncbi:XRE family transcriptional regulator [Dickeya oryzae]|uniref:XRE family transcriptional regulator n=1 Tax=Dickeya oryzae TaxID=1240404 RepID=UPI001AECA70E|nr:XRE family transcriptional regulator [Dickeya oryzae]MBP2845800.1 XRE family transcriptional regulator [Dickeya oryzae]